MKNVMFSFVVVALSLSLLSPLTAASQGLNVVHSFKNGDKTLDVVIYSKDADTICLLGIAQPGNRVSYGFRGTEWEQMRSLVKKAAAGQTKQWREEGSMAEIGTTSPSHLLIYVNETMIQFIISDPTVGTNNFLLPRSDVDEFLKQSAEAAKALVRPSATSR